MKTFEELGVNEEIRRAISEMGYENPMPIQEEVIPYLLGSGNDVIALAQTGTGKTAAYGLPLLQKVDKKSNETQAVILSPTRELCLQIADDLNDYSKYIEGLHVLPVYGGASIETQIHALRRGVQIIVATPGRLIDLMKRGEAKLGAVNNVVLDEADEMLNMGFSESIDAIFKGVPSDRNTLLFSATMSKEIGNIAKNYLHDYKEIVVGSRNEGAENVNHIYYMVNAKDKYLALKRIVDYNPRIFAIIFCRTKHETQEVADKLIHDGYNAESLHGDLSQQQRDLTMQKFRQHITQLLIATDVAARGLDVDDLTHVINFGLPDEIESYTHRSGRTGRAGKKGTSICIIHTRERNKMRAIEKEIGKDFTQGEIPSAKEICTKQLYKVIDEIEKADVNEEEIARFLPEINRRFDFWDKEDLIKKMVSLEFGKFLAYYADAPEIEKASDKGNGGGVSSKRGERNNRSRDNRNERSESRKPEAGFKRLFINLGKIDGFYPGRVMEFFNKNIEGHQEVGQIDLMQKFSYVEVPEKDVVKVMKALNGSNFEGREVRCNDSGEGYNSSSSKRSNGGGSRRSSGDRQTHRSESNYRGSRRNDSGNEGSEQYEKKSKKRNQADGYKKPSREERGYTQDRGKQDDWKQFFTDTRDLKGPDPDFNEKGWARQNKKNK